MSLPPRVALLVALGAVALGASSSAAADTRDEIELAERYGPVVRLVVQEEECAPGEPYEPLDVDVLFDDPTSPCEGPGAVTSSRSGRPREISPEGSMSTTSTFRGTHSTPAATTSAGRAA